MIRKLMMMQFAVTSIALAQTGAVLERAPQIGSGHKLACPPGTRQIGGPKSDLGAYACLRGVIDGMRIIHGPMVSFDNDGRVVGVGQMEESFRTGTWKFFDSSGKLIGITGFLKGEYHGPRLEYQEDGKLKFEENWVNGKRQGPQKTFDAKGLMTVTEYRDDRPLSK